MFMQRFGKCGSHFIGYFLLRSSNYARTTKRFQHKTEKEINLMSSSKNSKQPAVPSAREALNKFKMEAANDLDVPTPY